jgi:dTDP-glucose 4,6-dehydratase
MRELSQVLVTGALGSVGLPLWAELEARGHSVWGCDVRHGGRSNYQRCDVGEYRQVDDLLSRQAFDYVYHAAAEFGRNNGEMFYESLWRTNAIGTKNMIRLQERHRFRMIVFSSSEVYGDYPDVMTEDVMDAQPVKQMNDYAISKWVNELQVLNSAARFGTESVRVRLFNTYGPGEYYTPFRSAICMFVHQALHRLPYTVYLGHHRTSTYIDDCIRTLANIIDRFVPGEVYNIAGEEYHDMKMVSDMVLEAVGCDDSLVNYVEGEAGNTLDKKSDNAKARRDLGYETRTPLRDGIRRTVDWQRSVYGVR